MKKTEFLNKLLPLLTVFNKGFRLCSARYAWNIVRRINQKEILSFLGKQLQISCEGLKV